MIPKCIILFMDLVIDIVTPQNRDIYVSLGVHYSKYTNGHKNQFKIFTIIQTMFSFNKFL